MTGANTEHASPRRHCSAEPRGERLCTVHAKQTRYSEYENGPSRTPPEGDGRPSRIPLVLDAYLRQEHRLDTRQLTIIHHHGGALLPQLLDLSNSNFGFAVDARLRMEADFA